MQQTASSNLKQILLIVLLSKKEKKPAVEITNQLGIVQSGKESCQPKEEFLAWLMSQN